MRKSQAPKAATSVKLPAWQQTIALGLVNAEATLSTLVKGCFEDADWAVLDWDCDNAMDLALSVVQRMRQKTYQKPDDFERDWYQVAGVVSLATRGFSRSDTVYARTLESLDRLMAIVPELVEQSENYDAGG